MPRSESPVSRRTPGGGDAAAVATSSSDIRHRSSYDHRLRKRTRFGDDDARPGASFRVRNGNTSSPSPLLIVLPDDILSRILFSDYLDRSISSVSQISGVCRRFRSIASTSVSVLDVKSRGTRYISTRDFAHFVERYQGLREVDLSDCASFNDRQLSLLSPLRKNLQVLKLRGTLVSDNGLLDFFKYDLFRSRRERTSWNFGGKTNDECVKFESNSTLPLEILDLSNGSRNGKTRITDKTLAALASSCPELKILRMSWCEGITDEFLNSIPDFLTKLRALDLSMCAVTARGCCELARSSSLRSVDVSACPGIDGRAIWALVTGELRAKKRDRNTEVVEGEEIELDLSSIRERRGFSPLESISAQFAVDIDAKIFSMLSSRAPKLRTLDLRYYSGEMSVDSQHSSPIKTSIRQLRRKGVSVAIKY